MAETVPLQKMSYEERTTIIIHAETHTEHHRYLKKKQSNRFSFWDEEDQLFFFQFAVHQTRTLWSPGFSSHTNYFLVLRNTVEGSVKLLSDTQGCECNSPLRKKKVGFGRLTHAVLFFIFFKKKDTYILKGIAYPKLKLPHDLLILKPS